MGNRIYTQKEMENIVVRTLDFFESVDFSLAEWEKENEEDSESIPAKGTRHPSTRAERRKKTFRAKVKKAKTIHYRRYGFSWWDWSNDRPATESKIVAREKSELRDFAKYQEEETEIWDEDDFSPIYESYADYLSHYWYDEANKAKAELSKRDEYVSFLESRIRDLEKEIGF